MTPAQGTPYRHRIDIERMISVNVIIIAQGARTPISYYASRHMILITY